MNRTGLAFAAAMMLAAGSMAFAQDMDHKAMGHEGMTADGMAADGRMNDDMGDMDMGDEMDMGAPKGDAGPSSTAFRAANAKMHDAMDIDYSGNADVDFVRGMIAHHQGAIAMAKIELDFGKDAAMRKLAEGVIAAQESEIATMKAWLATNGG